MADTHQEQQIVELGKKFFATLSGEAPSIFNKDWWTGKVLDWAMDNEGFKTKLFHFVDVLPSLSTEEALLRHVKDYFGSEEEDIPAFLHWGAKHSGLVGKLSAKLLSNSLRKNIETMARQFIIGRDMDEAIATLPSIHEQQFTTTIDILGEASVSKTEALACRQRYLDLLSKLGTVIETPGNSTASWHMPNRNISVKPTSLFSQTHPIDWENSVNAICERFVPLIQKAKEVNAFIYIDMEQYQYKDITLEVYRRLRASELCQDFPNLGVVIQAYLVEAEQDIKQLLSWTREKQLPICLRLVKGAYWDYETIIAQQKGLPVPVYQIKAESDACFERCSELILKNHDICHFACASHNIRSIAAALIKAKAHNVPEHRYEFQVLYGMAGPVRRALLKIAKRVRLYCPYGELLPGMGYLVRRLLENTANESFLRQSFVDQVEAEQLLLNPQTLIDHGKAKTTARPPAAFHNESFPDFSKAALRKAMSEAILRCRKACGKTYPLLINGKEEQTGTTIDSTNPADPTEIIGTVCQATVTNVESAIASANQAAEQWATTPVEDRAHILITAASLMREQILDLSAWQILEAGKQWEQAYMDVAEAIDFLEYYAAEIVRLSKARTIDNPLGENNVYLYRPKGLTAVIAPWNFPLAISCGMSAAALAAGNTVLYKPSGLTPVVGYQLAAILKTAGLPDGVFTYLPGRGSEIGDYLVEHPDVKMIAFTGSAEVGLGIIERTARLHTSQNHVKKVIAEMGGKNAIIIDDDADLDQAVPQVIYSAFGYQGQKCSACSRVIVLADIFEKFSTRLVEAAQSLNIGPAEDPAFFMGPVIDRAAQAKILEYIEIAKREGTILLSTAVPEHGHYVPLTIVSDISVDDRIAQEEIFGPVLALMKAESFDEALTIANATPYALTGAVFSRSPSHLDQAKRQFKVGNLYLNRGSTGALVYRQPFGGFRLSGVGSKAGGPDYLLQFMDPVVICENTMRRGFTPMSAEE